MNPEIVFSVRHRHVSSPGECGWLRACGKARDRHFEHLQLTGSVQCHFLGHSVHVTSRVMATFFCEHVGNMMWHSLPTDVDLNNTLSRFRCSIQRVDNVLTFSVYF